MPMENEMHNMIQKVHQRINNKFDQSNELQKSYIHYIGQKHYLKVIRRVAYAYTYFRRQKDKNFTIRNTQIYAVLEACKSFFPKNKAKNKKKKEGVIYEIKTGEGKSCIVSLIAAVLAIKKYTVHIASSNIKLCLRDYNETLEFFGLLNLEPAVLLHKNELPNNHEYPKKFYADELFHNPSRMNFSICGYEYSHNEAKQASIVFSTFVNFECLYLNLMENYPGYIEKYFGNCGLLIDEADSILIDEITNGTIVSREMNSNAQQVLSKVYDNYIQGKSASETFMELKKKQLDKVEEAVESSSNEADYLDDSPNLDKGEDNPLYKDMDFEDIQQMYKEIEIVQDEEFCDGKKYSIETFTVKNPKRIENYLKITVDIAKRVYNIKEEVQEKIKEKVDQILLGKIKQRYGIGDEEEDDEEELNFDKTISFKKIIPFDYDHKGILEPNKEFSGFIPQFISLKEEQKYENLLFKNISISYLYVSHPIFAELYSNIVGFTGTVGNENDKKILKEEYKMKSKNVPRHRPNLMINLPMIACHNIKERNDNIVEEILTFHKKGNPILVIFQDFNEIKVINKSINDKGIKDGIIVFDGKTKEEMMKDDKIKGEKGSILLGTNICGRGTDIECTSEYPLHVIVSYYTHNTRVMEQAFGRTARNGQMGTCRCICLLHEYYQNNVLNSNKVKNIIDENVIKANEQREFIRYYKNNRPWIFEYEINKQSYTSTQYMDELKKLRSSKINVNRIVAYNYQFPVFMKYDTFLDIQSQRIFSLFNTPNCKYS